MIKTNEIEDFLIDYSISRDELYIKSLIANYNSILYKINIDDEILLFDGKNPHSESIKMFLRSKNSAYKFIGFVKDLPSSGFLLLQETIHRYNTFYNKNVDIQEIIEYIKHI